MKKASWQAQIIWLYIVLSCLIVLVGFMQLSGVRIHKLYTAADTTLDIPSDTNSEITEKHNIVEGDVQQSRGEPVKPLRTIGRTSGKEGTVTMHESLPVAVLIAIILHGSENFHIVNNTVLNWALLKPNIQPVLITDKARDKYHLTAVAKNAGWGVIEVSKEEFKSLKFSSVHSRVAELYPDAHFHCLSKHDLLFTGYFNFTIRLLKNHFVSGKQNVLVSGGHRLFTLPDKPQSVFTNGQFNVSNVESKSLIEATGEHRYYCTDNWNTMPDSLADLDSYNGIFSKMNEMLGKKLNAIDTTASNKAFRQLTKSTILSKPKHPRRKISAISRLYTREYRSYFELWRKEYEVFEFDLSSGKGHLLTDEI